MEEGEPFALLVGMQTDAATVESTMEFLKKLKMELPFDIWDYTLRISKQYMHP